MTAALDTPSHPGAPDRTLDAIAEAAAEWMVRMHAGGDRAPIEAALQEWLARDPRHAQVWRDMTEHLAPAFSCIRDIDRRATGQAALARRILSPALPASRRRLLMLGLAGAGAVLLAERTAPLTDLTADFHTRTGERRTFVLEDGSRLTLAARSAAKLSADPDRRALRLCRGSAVFAPHPERRAFELTDDLGTVRSTGGAFLVERLGAGLRVAALGQGVQIRHRSGQQVTLSGNEVAVLKSANLARSPGTARSLAAWTQDVLDVPDGTLGDVIDALRPWRAGLLRISEPARSVPVFGVFRLDDIDATLDALAASLPIRVWRAGSLFVSVDLRP